ncbi:tripartite tricarboxylate transporter permease [uncultured Clostridium sp.]|uniref:tripartite tricarboxylate transporter permease n=1 Tax=uncultured Clostridium sp. TaxID=59620 RepID=UPI0028E6407B|nr:tripartite tricarboxylate transporter permease [uncultured Clostridium sp.]
MLFDALREVLQPNVFMYNFIGVVVGMFIGTLPGLSATMGVALLTPLTFWLEPTQGLAMLLGVYNSSIWAGGISAILVNTPGTPASIAQTFDGYKMTQQGKVGLALGINTIFSVIGGLFSTFVLIVAAFPIAKFALKFGPPEYFALAIFGLSMMISVSGKEVVKGLIIGLLGLIISTIGMDPMFSVQRFTFGNMNLMQGISFIPIMIGMFGIGEILYQIIENIKDDRDVTNIKDLGRVVPTAKEFKATALPSFVSAIISVIIGAIPGTGGDIASIICWQQAKQMSKEPEKFGNGSVEGLAVTSLANNGVIGGTMTTMMTLGIPGDSVTAILIGSLMMYGMQPGPQMFLSNSKFVYNIMALLIVANLTILVLGLLTAKGSSYILKVQPKVIWVVVVLFCIIGSYALNNSLFDVGVMLISGLVGFLFRKLDIPLGPFILALLLGPIAESNFRRSLALSSGDYLIFISRPISIVLFIFAIVSLLYTPVKNMRNNKKGVSA